MQTARRALNLVRRTHPSSPFRRPSSHHRSYPPNHPDAKLQSPTFRHVLISSAHSPPSQKIPITGTSAASSADRTDSARSLLIGLSSGGLGSLCGIGGAVFAIPALVRFTTAASQRVAAGNSLFAVTAVSATAAASFYSTSSVDVSIATPLALSAAIFTPLGARAARNVDVALLRRTLGLFMLCLAPLLPLRDYMQSRRQPQIASPTDSTHPADHDSIVSPGATQRQKDVSPQNALLLAGYGSAVGAFSGFLGIGAGSILTPLIAASYPDMPFHTVMGTSFLAMIVPTAAGAASYARMGLTTPATLPALVVGACLGARLGSHLALSVSEERLHQVFAVVFAFMGFRTMRAPMTKQVRTVSNVSASKPPR